MNVPSGMKALSLLLKVLTKSIPSATQTEADGNAEKKKSPFWRLLHIVAI